MKFELTITMADPAGNRTAFVEGNVPREYYAAIGAALLREPDLKAEQAGFYTPPEDGATGRLEMMGGEFCGNAARSFGMWLGRRTGKKAGDTVPIEISGSSSTLEVLLEEGGASVSMPLPQSIIEVSVPEIPGQGKPSPEGSGFVHYPAVVLEGITHVILEHVPPSEALARSVVKEAVRKTEVEAAGAIFLDEDHMTPFVWVQATDSFVWESSCGSGTLAAATWLGRNMKVGTYSRKLVQPGGVLEASVTQENGVITEARIGGPVTLEEPVVKVIEL